MRTSSHKSHLRPGFIDPSGLVDFVPNGRFFLQVGKCEREPLTPFLEAATAAKQIAQGTTDPLWLCMSGGVDSECMALAFLQAQVPFRVAILRFHNDLNWYDIQQAIEFCKTREIAYRLFDLDVIQFYRTNLYLEFAKKYRCYSPQLCTHLYLLSRLEGFGILSGNIVKVGLVRSGQVVLGFPNDLYFCYDRFFQATGRAGVGLFLLYTPELIYSFFRLPRMQDLIFQRREYEGKGMSYTTKCDLYRDGGFPVLNREDKFTGFERVKKYFQEVEQSDEGIYNRMFRAPLENLFPPPRVNLFQVPQEYLKV